MTVARKAAYTLATK